MFSFKGLLKGNQRQVTSGAAEGKAELAYWRGGTRRVAQIQPRTSRMAMTKRTSPRPSMGS